MLQRAFDAEFKNDLEDMRAKRKEKQRKAAQQAGLMKRRLAMEKMLQEEQVMKCIYAICSVPHYII